MCVFNHVGLHDDRSQNFTRFPSFNYWKGGSIIPSIGMGVGVRMSHFTKIRTRLVDEKTLRAGLERLGYAVVDAQSGVSGWMGGTAKADFKIKPSAHDYEIGFIKSAGSYTIVADWWGIRSTSESAFTSSLTQAYGVEGAITSLAAQGFEVGEEVAEKDGTVRLTLRRSV